MPGPPELLPRWGQSGGQCQAAGGGRSIPGTPRQWEPHWERWFPAPLQLGHPALPPSSSEEEELVQPPRTPPHPSAPGDATASPVVPSPGGVSSAPRPVPGQGTSKQPGRVGSCLWRRGGHPSLFLPHQDGHGTLISLISEPQGAAQGRGGQSGEQGPPGLPERGAATAPPRYGASLVPASVSPITR